MIMRFPLVLLLLLVLHLPAALAQSVDHWETVVKADDTWNYFVGNSEPPATWVDPGFDATSWSSGKGGLGYGDGDDETIIPQTSSVYIRKSFTIADKSKIASALLYVDYDDGFVAYLNGHEIARANMGTDARPAFNQYAISSDNEAKLPAGGIPARFQLSDEQLSSYLVQGENVLALQVHNCNATSSDLSSSTFLIVGITDSGTYYQTNPFWFSAPVLIQHHLPLIVIETNGQSILSEPKITANIKVIDHGPGQTNTILDEGNQFDGPAGIEIRGQSSQMHPKKSYGFETRDASGEDVKVSLLGMPEESDWILSAQYSDKTLLRNSLSLHLGSRMGNYQPRDRFCEVYLNGEYIGIYQLIEKIKRDKNRVDIAKLNPDEISGDDLTGGYIFKVDKIDGLSSSEYFTTYPTNRFYNAQNYNYTYVYPKAEDIAAQQKTYLANTILSFENTMNGSSFKDPKNGYRKYIDVNSFIDILIINELGNNIDGLRFSTYFYKQKDSDGGKIFAGPFWDFDLCYGNIDFSPDHLSTAEWVHTGYDDDWESCIHWWARMMQDPDYQKAVKTRWTQLRDGPLKYDSITSYLDAQSVYLGAAIDRNFSKWPILNNYVWPNAFIGGSYKAEMDYLKNWIWRRLQWIDAQWLLDEEEEPEIPVGTLKVFPVPFTDQLTIGIKLIHSGDLFIDLYNMAGVNLLKEKISNLSPDYQEIPINTQNLPNGVYILRLYQTGGKMEVRKVIKQ